jgi:hypothetical protein
METTIQNTPIENLLNNLTEAKKVKDLKAAKKARRLLRKNGYYISKQAK